MPGARVRAPRLSGRGWVGTGGVELTLAGLRGRFVLLDFWTGCCINCVHVVAEIDALAQEFPDTLVVLGVHSPKFDHEKDPAAMTAAVQRLGVRHPVLHDPERRTWDAYAVTAWPTFVLVDPEGYVVHQVSGEGRGPELTAWVRRLLPEFVERGTLHPDAPVFVADPAPEPAVLFPTRLLPTDHGTVLTASRAELVELERDLRTVRARIPRDAAFSPHGVCRIPPEVARSVGYDVVVADAGGHRLFGLSSEELRTGTTRLRHVAGSGSRATRRSGGGPAATQPLSSPTDVVWFDQQVVVAMAGTHQLWAFDPVVGTVRVIAGTTAEGLHDGPADTAWCAQPSALAVGAGGDVLWFLDAETSALRTLERDGEHDRTVPVVEDTRMANIAPVARPGYRITTHVGQGLFTFGLRDSADGEEALLQHPLGLRVAGDGTVLIADTYNGALRRYDPRARTLATVLTGLAEPVDVWLEESAGTVVVAENAGHRLSRWPLAGIGCGDLCTPVGLSVAGRSTPATAPPATS